MDTALEAIRFAIALAALLVWGVGHAVHFVLSSSGRRNERLAGFLASTKGEYRDYWLAFGWVVVLVLAAITLKFAFDRSAPTGWITVGLMAASGLVLLRHRSGTRFWRVLFVILGSVAAFVDFILILLVWSAHGALIGLGLLLLQIALALGVVFVAARSSLVPLLATLGVMLLLAAPILAGVGLALLDEYVGRTASVAALGLGVAATGAAGPYLWSRDRDPDSFGMKVGYLLTWAISLCSVAFAFSPAIGWQAVALLAASASVSVVVALRLRRATPT